MTKLLRLCCATLLAGLLGVGPVLALHDHPEKERKAAIDRARGGLYAVEPYDPDPCHDRGILQNIMERFWWAERHTWHRGFHIAQIEYPLLRKNVFNGPSLIPHRHCVAHAVMTNGRTHALYYSIEDEMGFASIGDKVFFCIPDLDPWRIYGADCSTVR
ncbi:MAG TPA: hypothetical protein VHG92_03760 [Afifellaceae bacterium]|nr:hypothetical protein [Afifellaceae bacterium]